MTPFGRLFAKFKIGDACWEWHGARIPDGYGQIRWDGRNQGAHRVVYELLVSEIPEGMELDHLCRNPSCVKPTHLEPVTTAENQRRGKVGSRTRCNYGHPFDQENTYIKPSNGTRTCRECHRLASREWKAKQKVKT